MTRAEYARRSGRSSKWITPVRRLAIYIRDEFACCYCGRDLRDATPRELSLDHLHPRERGGDHRSSNLVTACYRCNSARQSLPWYQYATGGSVAYIKQVRRRVPNLKLARAVLKGTVPLIEVQTRQA